MNQSSHEISRLRLTFCLFLYLVFTYAACSPAFAMTAGNHSQGIVHNVPTHTSQQKNKPICLLDWQGNIMTTTAGVFIIDDSIEIVDPHNIKGSLAVQQKKRRSSRRLHRVMLEKKGRKIVRITIK